MTVGDLVRNARGGWATEAPTHCANGHWLGPDRVLVSTTACDCGRRHNTWWCREAGCGNTVYGPPLGADCRAAAGIDKR